MKFLNAMNWRTACALCLGGLMAVSFTACDDDDEEGDDTGLETNQKCSFDGMTITAAGDGTLTFSGVLKASKKVTKFYLKDAAGNEVKLTPRSENEKTDDPDWKWQANVEGTVKAADGPFELKFDQTFTATQTYTVGEKYDLEVGNSNSTLGSYISLTNKKAFLSDDVKAEGFDKSQVEVIYTGKKKDESKLASATAAKDEEIGAAACKSKVFDKDGKEITNPEDMTEGTIITANKCIASFKLEKTTETEAKISGVRYVTVAGLTITVPEL